MNDLIFAVFALAFLCLIGATVSLIQHPDRPSRLCAIATMTATCGDVR